MNKLITSVQPTIGKAVLDNANRELIKNHIMPIFPIIRGTISPVRQTSKGMMHIGNIPRNATIGKPKTGSVRKSGMATSVATYWRQEIVVRTGWNGIPFSQKISDGRAVKRRSFGNQTIIFLRRGRGVRKIITRRVD
jgi:hypothetical protein